MTDEQFHTSDVDIKSGQTDVGGDVIGQDKVGGDKATVGDIGAGTVTAIGRGAKAIQQIFVRNSLPGVVVFSVVAIALSSVVIAIVVTSGYDLKGVFEVAQGYATPTSASASIAMLTPTPTSSTALLSPNVMSVQKMETLVSDIVAGVGEVVEVVGGRNNQFIVVFEEIHDSRRGQVEIAIMLNRLYETYGLRHIGQEGVFVVDGVLDSTWFHPSLVEGQVLSLKEEIVVQLLADGEINSGEAMTLIYPDFVVHGTERAAEYNVVLRDGAFTAPT